MGEQIWQTWLAEIMTRHRGKTIGSLVGLAFGVLVIKIGWLWAIFLSLTTLVGYLVGRHLDEEEQDLAEMLDKILPPGRR